MHALAMFSDAHCHLDLYDKPEQVIDEAVARGVGLMITAGSNWESNVKNSALAKGAHVFCVAGISPDFSHDASAAEKLAELVKKNRNVIGIGETGLDMKIANQVSMDSQRAMFKRQMQIALELDVPVVVHSRKTIEETTRMVMESGVKRAMFHFFEGDEAQARLIERLGHIVSISPGMASKKKRVVKALDLGSMVAETDSPVVGKSPIDCIKVTAEIAKLKGVSVDGAAERLTENLRQFFYI